MGFQDLPDELQRKIMYSYNIHPVAEIFKQGIQETLDVIEDSRVAIHLEYNDENMDHELESSFAINYFQTQGKTTSEIYTYPTVYFEYQFEFSHIQNGYEMYKRKKMPRIYVI